MKKTVSALLVGLLVTGATTSFVFASDINSNRIGLKSHMRHMAAAKNQAILENNITFNSLREMCDANISQSPYLTEAGQEKARFFSGRALDKIEFLHDNLIGANRQEQQEVVLNLIEMHKTVFTQHTSVEA